MTSQSSGEQKTIKASAEFDTFVERVFEPFLVEAVELQPSVPDVPTAPPTPDTPEVDFDIRLGDVPDVPQIRDFKAPEIDLDIKFGADGKATLETDFVVEGPAELFKDDEFFNFADGVKRPTLDGFIEGIESPDLSTFQKEQADLNTWNDSKPNLLDVYDVP